jgi:hypothetical protein
LSYNDLVENIKSRELLLIWAHLKERRGTVQSDGYILSDLGKLIHPVTFLTELVNKPKEFQGKIPELIQVESDLAKANDLQLLQEALDRKAREIDKDY